MPVLAIDILKSLVEKTMEEYMMEHGKITFTILLR